jgi:hypothetical protein
LNILSRWQFFVIRTNTEIAHQFSATADAYGVFTLYCFARFSVTVGRVREDYDIGTRLSLPLSPIPVRLGKWNAAELDCALVNIPKDPGCGWFLIDDLGNGFHSVTILSRPIRRGRKLVDQPTYKLTQADVNTILEVASDGGQVFAVDFPSMKNPILLPHSRMNFPRTKKSAS